MGTLPTTIVPSSLGMYAAEPEVFREALCAAPVGMLLNAGFLWLWRVLPGRLPPGALGAQLATMVAVTLSAWSVGAIVSIRGVRTLLDAGASPEWVGVAATAAIVLIGIRACLDGVPAPKGAKRVGPATLVARGALAGGAILTGLLIAHSGWGLLAAMASVFPAIFLTAMVSVWWSQGRAVSSGAVGPMMLGSASVAAYALLAAALFPRIGPLAGSTIAWLGAAGGVTWPAFLWLERRST
jgi:hypothetical protein